MSRRTANKKLDQTVLIITKALTRTTNCIFRAKQWRLISAPQLLLWTFAPPPPLSNSFLRHCVHAPLFGSKSTISRFFRDDQYSLASFLFVVLLLTVPLCPAICKSGGHVPPLCPMESAPDHVGLPYIDQLHRSHPSSLNKKHHVGRQT